MSAIERCRTAALGGHVERCEKCSHTVITYNSCRNRHCPKCQGAAAREWLAEREAELLPVPYYHVVFTLPAPIADIVYQNKAVIYDLLFKASSETMLTIAADPEASRRSHWHLVRPPHLGLGNDPPPACAHDRARRRVLARRKAAGSRADRASSCPCASSHDCSAASSWRSLSAPIRPESYSSSTAMLDSPTRKSSPPFWDHCATENGWSTASAHSAALGGVAVSRALHPSCRHLKPPPDLVR